MMVCSLFYNTLLILIVFALYPSNKIKHQRNYVRVHVCMVGIETVTHAEMQVALHVGGH